MVFIVHPGTRSPPCLNVLRVPRSLSSQIIRETRNVKFTGLSFQGKQCNICFPPRRPGIAVVNYRVTFALCRARSRSDPDLPDLFIPRSPSLDLHHQVSQSLKPFLRGCYHMCSIAGWSLLMPVKDSVSTQINLVPPLEDLTECVTSCRMPARRTGSTLSL